VPYLSASAVVIHYEEALYQVYVCMYIMLNRIVFLESMSDNLLACSMASMR